MNPNKTPPIPSIECDEAPGGVLGPHIDPAEFGDPTHAEAFRCAILAVLAGGELISRPLNDAARDVALTVARSRAFVMVRDGDLYRDPLGGQWLLETEDGT